MTRFIGGLQLSGMFFEEVVRPILAATFPSLVYAAALIGPGSEVLGYDTALSTDHCWGARLFLLLDEHTFEAHGAKVARALHDQTPDTFRGYATNVGPPGYEGLQIQSMRRFFTDCLGFDPYTTIAPVDWLTTPQQALLELTAGAVYYDGSGELERLRTRLAYYPHDLWLYLMAAQWRRIAQQEAFVGRTGHVGDELGSMLVAAAIVRDLMRLCFLIERRYAPYSKWFGTAFSRLTCGPKLSRLCETVLLQKQWRDREAALAHVYEAVVTLHNQLGITTQMKATVSPFYDRPYLVIHAEQVATALIAAITDPTIRALPHCGALDQLSDSTDLLDYVQIYGKLRPLYE